MHAKIKKADEEKKTANKREFLNAPERGRIRKARPTAWE
jgi:hypothetical protein